MNTIMDTSRAKVAVVSIVYGDRWKFLSQVVESVMNDPHVEVFIIVDNGLKDKHQIEEGVKEYGEKVVILRQEKNKGSAGGFAVGIEYARGTNADFVLLLDDDSVPEDGAISLFLETLRFFPKKNVVLHGNRLNMPGNEEFFYEPIRDMTYRGTLFEVFSLAKILYFIKTFLYSKSRKARGLFKPIIPNEGFVYGGTFLPIDAVRKAPLPDPKLFLYGDDVEYSWGVIKQGYEVYLCFSPKIFDIDLTFQGSHITGLFVKEMSDFKVYFRMRNMALVSRRNTVQSKFALAASIIVWYIFLCVYVFFKLGMNKLILHRLKLIASSFYKGFKLDFTLPKNLEIPD